MRLQRQSGIFDHAVDVQIVLKKIEEVRRQFQFARRAKAYRQRHAGARRHAVMGIARRQIQQIALLDFPCLLRMKSSEDAQRRVIHQCQLFLRADLPAARADPLQ